MTAFEVLVVALTALNSIGLIGMALTIVRLKERLPRVRGGAEGENGPPVGAKPPDLQGRNGERLRYSLGRAQLVWFMQPKCSPCRLSAPAVRTLADSYAEKLSSVVNFSGTAEELLEYSYLWDDVIEVIPDKERVNVRSWGVNRTPSVFLIGADGSVQWSGGGAPATIERALKSLMG